MLIVASWKYGILASLLLLSACASGSSIRENARRSERGNCLLGPHDPGRIRALPGQGVPVRPPRNPFEDALPHCPADWRE